MGKKKEVKIIHEKNEITVKPADLMYFKNPGLCFQERKILEEFFFEMSKRKSDDELVYLSNKRILKILNVTEVKHTAMEEYLVHIAGSFTVRGPNGQFVIIGLINTAGWIDGPRKTKILKIDPTPAIKNLYSKIGEKGYQYFRYKALIIDYLTTTYALDLLSYIVSNMFRRRWRVTEKELKEAMNCYAKRYNEDKNAGKYFRYEILTPAIKEMNSSNIINVNYTYQNINEETLYEIEVDVKDMLPAKAENEAKQEKEETANEQDKREYEKEFKGEQLKYLREIAKNTADVKNGISIDLYLEKTYQKMCVHNPTNRYGYLEEMIKNDVSGTKPKRKQNKKGSDAIDSENPYYDYATYEQMAVAIDENDDDEKLPF